MSTPVDFGQFVYSPPISLEQQEAEQEQQQLHEPYGQAFQPTGGSDYLSFGSNVFGGSSDANGAAQGSFPSPSGATLAPSPAGSTGMTRSIRSYKGPGNWVSPQDDGPSSAMSPVVPMTTAAPREGVRLNSYPSSSSGSGLQPPSTSSNAPSRGSGRSPVVSPPSGSSSSRSSGSSNQLQQPKELTPVIDQRPYSPKTDMPVYGRLYGSSYVTLQPDTKPFNEIVAQLDDEDVGPSAGKGRNEERRKRKRLSASPAEGALFDPTAPSLPRASTGNFPGLYSVSGFDAMGVIARVMFRPSPQIELGPIDMSTAFCVVDARKSNLPIVYASESFSSLTGYRHNEIVGQNCRFLQSPNGRVEQGSRRTYTDENGVYHLRKHITSARETQASIINYRKDKSPFINLITIIPITWESDEVAYFVGFQMDMVEQPKELLKRMRQGNYTVNFGLLPGPPLPPPSKSLMPPPLTAADSGQSSSSGRESPDSASSAQYSEERAILEALYDFVFVVSLKGAVLYASPQTLKVLGYTMQELLSTNISDICHPSDVVHVVRELKEAAANTSAVINVTFRARCKSGNTFWMDANGKLQVEVGKNRKSVVLTGRPSSVPSLAQDVLSSTGGITGAEFWHRLTPNGLCLYASTALDKILGLKPQRLVGNSFQKLLMTNQRAAFNQALESAASKGAASALRHSIQNSEGKWQDMVTTFFPPTSFTSIRGQQRDSVVLCQTATHAARAQKQPKFNQVSPGQAVPFISAQTPEQPTPVNVLKELEPSKSTSWHFELQKMQMANRKMKEDIERLEQIKAARAQTKQRTQQQAPQHSSDDELDATATDFQNQSLSSAPPPIMPSCSSCGSSDIQSDQLGAGAEAVCATCAMRWHQVQTPTADLTPNSMQYGAGASDYDGSFY